MSQILLASTGVLQASGADADRIAKLGWLMIILSAIVFVGVSVVLALAVTRGRAAADESMDLTDRGTGWIVYGGALMPALVLTVILVAGMALLGVTPAHDAEPAVTVKVTGHQWWWEIEYTNSELQSHLITANELHVPVGVPVRLLLTSADVIHSFWVPELNGKLDLIPGDTNDLRLTATTPGAFRGQCAEYCGLQHAHMGIVVVAESPQAFRAWWRDQLAPAAAPADTMHALGQRIFVTGSCAMCHTIRGTPAQGRVAPDLTHVGSRSTIAAGTIPNSLGNLEGWITNAPSIKPGVLMPALTEFSGSELRALAEYVYSLK
jgi:cytochrome c oxidase subunit 2